MKIAVGTTDRARMCDHLARSAAFAVYEVENGQILSTTLRERFSDQCGRHSSFVEMLEGCEAVLCGGIGQGAWDALIANGIRPIVAVGSHTCEEALKLYLAGQLQTTTDRVCLCG